MKKYGRGGVLGLGSVLAKQSGASRTSPVLRGNWLVETLLGEKTAEAAGQCAPSARRRNRRRKPDRAADGREARSASPNVPSATSGSIRSASPWRNTTPSAGLRENDLAGRPIDTEAQLKDGTEFDGLDGLRNYLLTQRKEDVPAAFLHEAARLCPGPNGDPVRSAAGRRDAGRTGKERISFSAAVLPIVRSKQFCNHRGMDATKR